jgi:hypothetical protein
MNIVSTLIVFSFEFFLFNHFTFYLIIIVWFGENKTLIMLKIHFDVELMFDFIK